MSTESRNPAGAQSARRRFAFGIAAFYAASTGLIGTYLPFFPVWLRSIGVEAWWIGITVAVPACMRFTLLPFITGFAERRRILRQAIVVATFVSLAGFATIGLLRDPIAILIVFAVTACAWTPQFPMADGYALKGVIRHGLSYGPLRLWGSVSFIVGAIICGALANIVPAAQLIWIIAASALLSALSALWLAPLEIKPSEVHTARPARALLREPAFLAIIVTAALVQGSHAAYYSFASITWQAVGLDSVTISILWSLGVVAEIVVFALSPRFRGSPALLVIAGALGATIRWIMTAQEPSIALLALIQLMHGMSFGMTHIGSVGLIVRAVPHTVIASAQGYMVAAIGIVMSVATMTSGAVYASAGQHVYYAMAAMSLVALVVIVAMRNSIERHAQPQSAASGA